jgi:hypothetical protein
MGYEERGKRRYSEDESRGPWKYADSPLGTNASARNLLALFIIVVLLSLSPHSPVTSLIILSPLHSVPKCSILLLFLSFFFSFFPVLFLFIFCSSALSSSFSYPTSFFPSAPT